VVLGREVVVAIVVGLQFGRLRASKYFEGSVCSPVGGLKSGVFEKRTDCLYGEPERGLAFDGVFLEPSGGLGRQESSWMDRRPRSFLLTLVDMELAGRESMPMRRTLA
jgi:hypothetical protein